LYRAGQEIAACSKLYFSPMLAGGNVHRKRAAGLPKLSWIEDAAVEATFGAGSSIWICGCFAVALWNVRNAVLCARGAGAQPSLCTLRALRQFGIAANRRGARPRDEFAVLARVANSSVALRTVPAQIFFGETAVERRTKSGSHAGEVTPVPK
jgi:hypothetical protein